MIGQDIRLIEAADIAGWAQVAKPGERLIYCTGPFVPPGTVKAIVRYLVEARTVRSHLRRADGGALEHYLIKRGQEEPPAGRWRTPDDEDAAIERIYAALERCVRRGRRAYSNHELARIAGLATRHQAAWRVKKLAEAGRIRIETTAGADGSPWRIVRIGARASAGPERGR